MLWRAIKTHSKFLPKICHTRHVNFMMDFILGLQGSWKSNLQLCDFVLYVFCIVPYLKLKLLAATPIIFSPHAKERQNNLKSIPKSSYLIPSNEKYMITWEYITIIMTKYVKICFVCILYCAPYLKLLLLYNF